MEFADLIRFFEQDIPFNAHLGLRVASLEPGSCRVVAPFRDVLIGDPFRPALHGGVLSTVLDTAGGLAVYSTLGPGRTASTVDLRVDYLRPGRLVDVVCDAKVIRVGNRVAVTSMTLHHGDPAEAVAEGRGVYNIHTTQRH